MDKPIQVFCCYAHEDQPYLLQLKKQLKPLERDGLIVVQADIDVIPGEEWEQKISYYLNTAQMILLLVSSDFIVSEYCYSTEMVQALARHERGEAIVIPIILRPVHWQGTSLGKLEALPKNAIAVVDRSWQNQDEAFFNIAEGIRNIVEKQRMKSTTTTHHTILGYPPPTDPKTIQQREEVTKDVYMRLIQPDSTAVVLTGIGGLGKSTLAALVYRYAEEQRQAHNGLFTAEALWLTIDRTVTMVDLAMTLFEALSKPVPDFNSLTPRSQALDLFKALDTVDKARLIILDQFENLLGWPTGHTLPDHPGVGEWLDVMNSKKCTCRILITSRHLPQGSSDYPLTYMREYPVQGLGTSEGASLLRKQGVGETQAIEADSQQAVKRCDGHALALTLLASILRNDRGLSLKRLLQDPSYVSLWAGDIAARSLLDHIYTSQLNDEQRQLLRAFSVFREPVPLEAVHSLITGMTNTQILNANNVLLAQHLLNSAGEGKGCYQLHAIVASYAQTNLQTVREMHKRAAQYYRQQASNKYLPKENRRNINDVQPLIEAAWQYCQARMLRSAWDLIQQEEIFSDLRRWGGNAILLELYQLLLSVDTWPRELMRKAHIYTDLGEIYSALGQKEQAVNYLEQALNIYKESEDRQSEGRVLNDLGGVYSSLGQKERAQEYYKEAQNLYSISSNRREEGAVLKNLGSVFEDMGQKEEAQECYEQAWPILKEVGDEKGVARILSNLGLISGKLGQYKEAEEYCKQALRISQQLKDLEVEGDSLYNLGQVSSGLGRNTEALEYFQKALAISKLTGDRGKEGRRSHALGQVYRALGQKEEALRCYEQAQHLSIEVEDRWGEGQTMNDIGQIYDELGQMGEARKCYELALQISKEVGDREGKGRSLGNLGRIYEELRQKEEALSYYEQARLILKATKDIMKESWTLNKIGTLYHELGQEEEALQAYEQALRLNPNYAAAYNGKGAALKSLQRYQEALQAYEQALRLNPNYAVAYNGKGTTLNILQRYQEALQAHEQALRLNPNYVAAYNGKGAALKSLQRHQEALQAYEQALRLNPNDAVIYYNKGIALYDLQRYQEALQAYEQALRLNPNDALAYKRKGDALDKLNRNDEALQAYKKASQISSSQ